MLQRWHTDIIQWRITQWTWYKFIIISQRYEEITLCKTSKTIIPATKMQKDTNNKKNLSSEESKNK